jgi:hypothetical protein
MRRDPCLIESVTSTNLYGPRWPKDSLCPITATRWFSGSSGRTTIPTHLHGVDSRLSLSPSPVAHTLEHSAYVKRFVSLQFLNPKTVGRTPCTVDQPVAMSLPTETRRHPCLEWILTHNPSVRASEDSSFLRRAATVIGHLPSDVTYFILIHKCHRSMLLLFFLCLFEHTQQDLLQSVWNTCFLLLCEILFHWWTRKN